jgi:hypothetical protein
MQDRAPRLPDPEDEAAHEADLEHGRRDETDELEEAVKRQQEVDERRLDEADMPR